MSIQKCNKCVDGYLIVKTKNEVPFLGCTNYKPDGSGCNNTLSSKLASELPIGEVEFIENEKPIKIDDEIPEDIEGKLQDSQDEKTEEKNLRYFSNDDLNNLALELRHLAEELAKKEGVVFWKILRQKAICDICKKLPTSIEEFYDKKVLLGKEKVKKYGEMILDIVKRHDHLFKTQPKRKNSTIKYGVFDIMVNEEGEVLTDTDLLGDLRIIRKKVAEEKAISAFVVASNRLLVLLATYKPQSKNDFLSIKGIGDKWYENYSKYFVERISKSI